MRSRLWSLLLAPLLLGCPSNPTPSAAPTGSAASVLLSKAEQAHKSSDHEGEALALREAVDLLAREGPSPQLQSAQDACVQAMVEAGDNVASYRLWNEMEKKNGPTMESGRMKARARSLMLQQAQELEQQVALDLKSGRPAAAQCTARAALHLLEEAGAEKKQVEAARAAAERLEKAADTTSAASSAPQP